MDVTPLVEFVQSRQHLLVITGAGVSTGSGIPDYRDANGAWKRKQPMYYQEFVGDELARRRYWARSMLGWPLFAAARPNTSHQVLARMQQAGLAAALITQNVDGLHQAAGSTRVVDLHGRLDQVVCLQCGDVQARARFQQQLGALNPRWAVHSVSMAPDGDADLHGAAYEQFQVPACARCQGVLKPHVVFFGENVPRERVRHAQDLLLASDGVLVVGSSLMVWSGFRFARAAAQRGVPVVVINQGRTRADELLSLKVEAPCEAVFTGLERHFDLPPAAAAPNHGVSSAMLPARPLNGQDQEARQLPLRN